MSIAVNLWSKKAGELRSFLESYYDKKVIMDDDVEQWIYVYNKPLESIDLISAVMDNSDKYNIVMFLQIDKCDLHPVTRENYNDIIKGIFTLFYDEA